MALKAITANRLLDGEVVWLGPGGAWVDSFEACAVFEDAEADAALARAQEDERRQVVVAPYAMDVERAEGRLAVARVRERIRAEGPTVRRDLGKQAARAATEAA